MLYQLFRFLLRITKRFYFKNLQVKGLENIPQSGPVFIVANHPSAFMDPIVIATITNRPLYFLGKGILFQNKILQWFLPNVNVIPIYRSHESEGHVSKNKEAFVHCYRHFEKGGALLIFPEGVSLTERKLKKLKTGTARICLGAEADNNYGLDIKIVTIGLNYSNPHEFQSDLFINIDKPIHVSDYYELYKQDTFKGVHALTDEIRKRLETQVVAIQDAEVEKLVSNVELIYKSQILRDLGRSPKNMMFDFNATKSINESVNYFTEHEPERVDALKNKIDTYLNELEQLSLNDTLIKSIEKTTPLFDSIKSMIFLIFGFPLFAFGFINNFLPFKIPGWAAPRISSSREFYGAISMSMGTFTFLLFYSLQIWLATNYTSSLPFIVAYSLLLPFSGLFAYYYYNRFVTIRGNWRVLTLFYKKTRLITALITKRQQIIEELENARKEFVAYRDGRTNINEAA